MIMKKTALLIIVIFISFQLKAQVFETVKPVIWQYNTKKISDTEYELKIIAQIAGGWHLYGQYFEKGGPIPLSLKFEESNKYKLIGKTTETPKPKTEFDEIFKLQVNYFSKYAIFTQKIKLKEKSELKINLTVEGQACKNTDGQCVLTKDRHTFSIK